MIDYICQDCLCKGPDIRCEHYVKRMVGECKGDDVRTMKLENKKYKVSDCTCYPVKAPDWLVLDLEHIARSKERVNIYIRDPQQKFDQRKDYYFEGEDVVAVNAPTLKEVKWVGYVRRSQGVIRKPMLFTYVDSKKGREIPVLMITHMEWRRAKRGRMKQISPDKQPVF
jgi:hypothetical protein